jgi:hypothetical protein
MAQELTLARMRKVGVTIRNRRCYCSIERRISDVDIDRLAKVQDAEDLLFDHANGFTADFADAHSRTQTDHLGR